MGWGVGERVSTTMKLLKFRTMFGVWPLSCVRAQVLDPRFSLAHQLGVEEGRRWATVLFSSALEEQSGGREGVARAAHQFILAARSRYFRSLLKDSGEGGWGWGWGVGGGGWGVGGRGRG
jgi:hypothetical protein